MCTMRSPRFTPTVTRWPMPARRRIAGAALLLLGVAAAGPAAAAPDLVNQWNVVALEAGRSLSPLMQARALAMVHAAMFDAANGVDRRFVPYLIDEKAPAGVSAAAAVAAAAHTVLRAQYPEREALFSATLATTLARVAAGPGRDGAVAFGQRIGAALLLARQADGAGVRKIYQPTPAIGAWRPTPPAQLPALGLHWGDVQPFLIGEPTGFTPPPPPPLTSAQYARDFAEVKDIGGKNSTLRSVDQTEASVFWTAFAPHIWSSAARQAITRRPNLSLVERTRVFALMSGAIADAFIVGWSSKFKHGVWRPVTAIRLADSDGNDATSAAGDWEPLIETPPFPCYPSGHAVTSGAAERALALALGTDRLAFQITNAEVGLTRHYRSFSQLAREAVEVRIWSGVHFRVSQEEGLKAGHKIGEASGRTRLVPIGSMPQWPRLASPAFPRGQALQKP
jgi:hypothetical protein